MCYQFPAAFRLTATAPEHPNVRNDHPVQIPRQPEWNIPALWAAVPQPLVRVRRVEVVQIDGDGEARTA